MGNDTTPTQPDHVYVAASSVGIELIGGAGTPDEVSIHIPWDQAVQVSRLILQLARDHGDVT